ncbi:MAG: hypothetical protein J7J76_06200 [Candidatus Latescibacteria bacterium]|nr:hypothetical protein [Candidatus Latescibacterota bacterium]
MVLILAWVVAMIGDTLTQAGGQHSGRARLLGNLPEEQRADIRLTRTEVKERGNTGESIRAGIPQKFQEDGIQG